MPWACMAAITLDLNFIFSTVRLPMFALLVSDGFLINQQLDACYKSIV